MTEPQARFFQLDAKFPAFIGGFGSGKAETLANCALRDALASSDTLIALYEPTYDLVRLILAPRMEKKLSDMGIRYKYNKQKTSFTPVHRTVVISCSVRWRTQRGLLDMNPTGPM